MGLLSYRSYWTEVLVGILQHHLSTGDALSLTDISSATSITPDDLLHTIHALDLLKYYKGQYVLCLTEKHVKEWERAKGKTRHVVDGECLNWTPPVFTAAQLRYL